MKSIVNGNTRLTMIDKVSRRYPKMQQEAFYSLKKRIDLNQAYDLATKARIYCACLIDSEVSCKINCIAQ